MRVKKCRRGQAMIELAMGMFALALVVSALCGFAIYIAKSLEMQNSLRVKSSHQTDTVDDITDFAEKYVFGTKQLKIEEKVVMPSMVILK